MHSFTTVYGLSASDYCK